MFGVRLSHCTEHVVSLHRATIEDALKTTIAAKENQATGSCTITWNAATAEEVAIVWRVLSVRGAMDVEEQWVKEAS